MAAIAIRKVSAMSAASNTDATAYSSTSNAPVATRVYYVVSAALRAAGQSVTPTLAGTNGWNVTWTAIANVLSGNLRETLFRGTTGADVTAGVLTATYTGETQDAHCLSTYLLTNVSEAPVQSKTGAVTDTTLTVTFDSGLSDNWNAVALFIANNTTTGAMALVDDVDDYGVGAALNAADGVRVNARFSPINKAAMTVSGLTSSPIAGILVELDHDGSDVTSSGGTARLVGSPGLLSTGVH